MIFLRNKASYVDACKISRKKCGMVLFAIAESTIEDCSAKSAAKRSLSILTRQSLRVYTFHQKRKFWRIYEKVFSFFVNFPRDDFIMQ